MCVHVGVMYGRARSVCVWCYARAVRRTRGRRCVDMHNNGLHPHPGPCSHTHPDPTRCSYHRETTHRTFSTFWISSKWAILDPAAVSPSSSQSAIHTPVKGVCKTKNSVRFSFSTQLIQSTARCPPAGFATKWRLLVDSVESIFHADGVLPLSVDPSPNDLY